MMGLNSHLEFTHNVKALHGVLTKEAEILPDTSFANKGSMLQREITIGNLDTLTLSNSWFFFCIFLDLV